MRLGGLVEGLVGGGVEDDAGANTHSEDVRAILSRHPVQEDYWSAKGGQLGRVCRQHPAEVVQRGGAGNRLLIQRVKFNKGDNESRSRNNR